MSSDTIQNSSLSAVSPAEEMRDLSLEDGAQRERSPFYECQLRILSLLCFFRPIVKIIIVAKHNLKLLNQSKLGGNKEKFTGETIR